MYHNGEGIIPNKTTRIYWIHQDNPNLSISSQLDDTAGKWLIFIDKCDVDDAWRKIRDATHNGELGISAKVSTAKDEHSDKKVIYVFTSNWEDVDDVMRVREKLKQLGFVDRIGYKRNIETYEGE